MYKPISDPGHGIDEAELGKALWEIEELHRRSSPKLGDPVNGKRAKLEAVYLVDAAEEEPVDPERVWVHVFPKRAAPWESGGARNALSLDSFKYNSYSPYCQRSGETDYLIINLELAGRFAAGETEARDRMQALLSKPSLMSYPSWKLNP